MGTDSKVYPQWFQPISVGDILGFYEGPHEKWLIWLF